MSLARRSPNLLGLVFAVVAVVGTYHGLSTLFLPAVQPSPRPEAGTHAGNVQLVASTAGALVAGASAPAWAEEEGGGLLNFGKIELGGGFAINLDIPETGIVNIAVLIAGLVYLLGPLLSNSMESREKEITQDIGDAISKFDEASGRLAEAEKAKAQADEVIAEIEASIAKDQAEFKAMIESQTKSQLEAQAAAAELSIKTLQDSASSQVENYVQQQAIQRGVKEVQNLSDAQKAKFMEQAIASL